MLSVPHSLRVVKQDLPQLLEPQTIFEQCRRLGYRWRNRILDPAATCYLLILQILHRNTACSALRHITGIRFSASAYCQARQRLPLKVITSLVRHTAQRLGRCHHQEGLWKGHRVWMADGSGISMPDTPSLQKTFGYPGGQKPGCGFPVTSILVLMQMGTGLLMDLVIRPLRTHEASGVHRMHPQLNRGDVLVGDRGFCSYAHLGLLLNQGLHAVFRAHQTQRNHFQKKRGARHKTKLRGRQPPRSRLLCRLGFEDHQVVYAKPQARPKWIDPQAWSALPRTLRVRELRYAVHRRGFRTREITLVTTLLDSETYPKHDLARLYQQRWQVEVYLRDLKVTLGMSVLRGQSVDVVQKELWMFMMVYNLVRHVMMEAGRRQGVEPDRISFIDALRWLCFCRAGQGLVPLVVNPDRPGRVEPRVLKRRPLNYPLMSRPRDALRAQMIVKEPPQQNP